MPKWHQRNQILKQIKSGLNFSRSQNVNPDLKLYASLSISFHTIGWLRFVGSFKLYVSFVEYSLFYRALLQKSYNISPYVRMQIQIWTLCLSLEYSPYYGVATISCSLKLYFSFVEYSLFHRALLQKRPIILRSMLIVATPYVCVYLCFERETHKRGIHPRETHRHTQTLSREYTDTLARESVYIGLFCKRSLSKRLYSTKETCNFKEPTKFWVHRLSLEM